MLVADADVPGPVIAALKILKYPIATYQDIGAPVRPDTALIEHMLSHGHGRVLVTHDRGIPAQAYIDQFHQRGLTVVLLRWKTSTPRDFQEMALRILQDGVKWEEIAEQAPSVISANRTGYRIRPWTDVPESIAASRRPRQT